MINRIGRAFRAIPLYLKYRRFGIDFLFLLRYRNRRKEGKYLIKFFGKEFVISSPYWFLHSIDELFIQEIYRFNAKTDDPYIIDCGANWGLSCIYFKRIFPKAKIEAFEPDPAIFEMLSTNLNHFGYSDIRLHQKAVWKTNETLNFIMAGSLGGALANVYSGQASEKVVEIEGTSISGYLKQHVDLLKIDIEGAEFEVLDSIRDCLANVERIFVEYHSSIGQEQHLPELLSIIKEAGYRIYIMEAWKNLNHPLSGTKPKGSFDLQLNIFGYRA